ncbi:hypothetical protein H6F76_18025 [Leptolyngbya sp. FACHB-321]|uniref:hypothetical protein n=1 Tax=Leptolyngbya sp. FACHB-321 TaxID=2692807 RepID=UPI001681F8E6|nr:hypothetical protein [Leptolyngbya sp. FACHB-321]MBD2036908.1 hypothetical protein [Leptolyngbya sp. FACHB-321]
MDFFDAASGSTEAILPVFNACNPDAFVAPLLRGATNQGDRPTPLMRHVLRHPLPGVAKGLPSKTRLSSKRTDAVITAYTVLAVRQRASVTAPITAPN